MTFRVVTVGEGMLELVARGDGCRLGYGGDALNTAIHLARFGLPTAFLSALGADAFSADLRRRWQAEGLSVELLLTDPERQPGLYAVHTGAQGERTFQYWREDSAARRVFELAGSAQAAASAARAELLLFSLISLAILPPAGRRALLELARAVRRNGGRIAFDGNYRERLWDSREEAREACRAALAVTDCGLPTASDEGALFGDDDPQSVIRRWTAAGVREVAVKTGADGCVIAGHGRVAPPRAIDPLDTSGAGDAFNAGYLSARLEGEAPPVAALRGHALAGWVISRPGAIPPRDAQAPYDPGSMKVAPRVGFEPTTK